MPIKTHRIEIWNYPSYTQGKETRNNTWPHFKKDSPDGSTIPSLFSYVNSEITQHPNFSPTRTVKNARMANLRSTPSSSARILRHPRLEFSLNILGDLWNPRGETDMIMLICMLITGERRYASGKERHNRVEGMSSGIGSRLSIRVCCSRIFRSEVSYQNKRQSWILKMRNRVWGEKKKVYE